MRLEPRDVVVEQHPKSESLFRVQRGFLCFARAAICGRHFRHSCRTLHLNKDRPGRGSNLIFVDAYKVF